MQKLQQPQEMFWFFSYYIDGKYAQPADRLAYSSHEECPPIPQLSPATSDMNIFRFCTENRLDIVTENKEINKLKVTL